MKNLWILSLLICHQLATAQINSSFLDNINIGVGYNGIQRGKDPDYSLNIFQPRVAVSVFHKVYVGISTQLYRQKVENFDTKTTALHGAFVQWYPYYGNRLAASVEAGYYRGNHIQSSLFPANGPESKPDQDMKTLRIGVECRIIRQLALELAFNLNAIEAFDFDNTPTIGLVYRINTRLGN